MLSIDDRFHRFDSKWIPEPNTGCWLWVSTSSAGYGVFWPTGGPRQVRAHRFSYQLRVGPVPTGMSVCHRCDTPMCVNPDHLFLGTHDDNMADMATKGRNRPPRGEKCGTSKLTEQQVRAIRSDGRAQRLIARDYGVSKRAVNLIINRKTWEHVQ